MPDKTPLCPPETHPSDCEILDAYRTRSRARVQQPNEAERLLYARAEPVRLLLLDVDGVLTDGSLIYSESGAEAKSFNSQDGLGIRLVQQAGIEVGIITARSSELVRRRAEELGMKYIAQGVANKYEAFKKILKQAGLKPYQACYMGDDWIDLGLLARVGLAVCPANAVAEVQEACHWVAERPGGGGAVREACDLIIRSRGLHDALLQQFLC